MAALPHNVDDLPGIVATPDDPVLVLEMRDGEGRWLTWYVRRSDYERLYGPRNPEDPAVKERHELLSRLYGAWGDLDADEMLDDLDRIRHANPPTPPIDDL